MFHFMVKPRPPTSVARVTPRPGGGLLGDGDDAAMQLVHGGVHLLQEADRFQVLPAAVDIRRPAAVGARVVQVQHRGDGVDAQAVDVELLDPESGIGDQEVADLVAAEVENESAPVELLAAARVGVFVERGAVEAGQCPFVAREVRGDPVQEYPDARVVQVVDEVAEVVGAAETRGRGVVGGDLVSPRSAERVLGHRQQFDVGESGRAQVLGQLMGQFAVVEAGPPGAEVDFVGAHGERSASVLRALGRARRCRSTRGRRG